jgi:peroxiredoxin
MEPLQIGDQVPDIRLPLVNGLGDAGFRDFAGKRLIVFAWASW